LKIWIETKLKIWIEKIKGFGMRIENDGENKGKKKGKPKVHYLHAPSKRS